MRKPVDSPSAQGIWSRHLPAMWWRYPLSSVDPSDDGLSSATDTHNKTHQSALDTEPMLEKRHKANSGVIDSHD